MIRHIVMWRFQKNAEGATAQENMDKAAALLNALPAKIPYIRQLVVGKNLVAGAANYDMGLSVLFDTLEDLKSYQVHPEHRKVSEFITKVRTDRATVDLEDPT